MQYRLLILNDNFEEEVVEFIHSSMQKKQVPADQAEYDYRFDAFRGVLHMHWLGICRVMDLPKHLDEPQYYERVVEVNEWDTIDFPVAASVPIIPWQGRMVLSTEVRQVFAATALSNKAPDRSVYSSYTIVTEGLIASSDAEVREYIERQYLKLKANEVNLKLGVILRSNMEGGDRWRLN